MDPIVPWTDREAIFQLTDRDGRQLGTAFLGGSRFAITAFHCVPPEARDAQMRSALAVVMGTESVPAHYIAGDEDSDFAILEIADGYPLPRPLQLARQAHFDDSVRVIGWPLNRFSHDHVTISGRVVNAAAALFDAPAIQIFSQEAAHAVDLHGMSGSPVISERRVGMPRVIGVLRWNPPDEEDPRLASGGRIFACPSTSVLRSDLTSLEDLLEHDAGVYIAYADVDLDIAKKLVTLIRKRGFDATARFLFCPHGDSLKRYADDILEVYPVMLLLYTNNTSSKPDQMFEAELEYATRTRAPTIPVYTHGQTARTAWSDRRPINLYSVHDAVARADLVVEVVREAIIRNALRGSSDELPGDSAGPLAWSSLPEMDFRLDLPEDVNP